MVHMATYTCATYSLVINRIQKPFNPMLGETYELITDKFRLYSELVSHHPPVIAFNCQGNRWEMDKNVETIIKFNGKHVTVEDFNLTHIKLHPKCLKVPEHYVMSLPKMTVGNLMFG